MPLSDSTKRALDSARKLINRDPSLAAYILRDMPEIKVLGLDELALELARDPYVSKNDVRYLIVRLEALDKEGADAS